MHVGARVGVLGLRIAFGGRMPLRFGCHGGIANPALLLRDAFELDGGLVDRLTKSRIQQRAAIWQLALEFLASRCPLLADVLQHGAPPGMCRVAFTGQLLLGRALLLLALGFGRLDQDVRRRHQIHMRSMQRLPRAHHLLASHKPQRHRADRGEQHARTSRRTQSGATQARRPTACRGRDAQQDRRHQQDRAAEQPGNLQSTKALQRVGRTGDLGGVRDGGAEPGRRCAMGVRRHALTKPGGLRLGLGQNRLHGGQSFGDLLAHLHAGDARRVLGSLEHAVGQPQGVLVGLLRLGLALLGALIDLLVGLLRLRVQLGATGIEGALCLEHHRIAHGGGLLHQRVVLMGDFGHDGRVSRRFGGDGGGMLGRKAGRPFMQGGGGAFQRLPALRDCINGIGVHRGPSGAVYEVGSPTPRHLGPGASLTRVAALASHPRQDLGHALHGGQGRPHRVLQLLDVARGELGRRGITPHAFRFGPLHAQVLHRSIDSVARTFHAHDPGSCFEGGSASLPRRMLAASAPAGWSSSFCRSGAWSRP